MFIKISDGILAPSSHITRPARAVISKNICRIFAEETGLVIFIGLVAGGCGFFWLSNRFYQAQPGKDYIYIPGEVGVVE
jgi:hypothetical protein